jgi:hypothetical protein
MADEWDQFPDDDPWSQFPDAESAEPKEQALEPTGLGLGRGAGLVSRAVVQGLAAAPLAAMDAGVAVRNISESAMSLRCRSYSRMRPRKSTR